MATLLKVEDPALKFWVERDLLKAAKTDCSELWSLPEVEAILKKQQPYGGWDYPKKDYGGKEWGSDFRLLETFRQLRILVEMYGLNRRHPAMDSIKDFIFTFQSKAGALRGIIGNQYMPYYQGAITELLIKAGYEKDSRVQASLRWLLSMRQDDGGWIVPMQAVPPSKRNDQLWKGRPVTPDRTKPSSHMATGMALRPFAALVEGAFSEEVADAARLLASRLFSSDKYNDRRSREYWLKFQYPFWWTDLVSAIDSLSRLGMSKENEHLRRGVQWFIDNQSQDGVWETGYGKGNRSDQNRVWVGLAVCRNLMRLSESERLTV